jgi:hypothetical protein
MRASPDLEARGLADHPIRAAAAIAHSTSTVHSLSLPHTAAILAN